MAETLWVFGYGSLMWQPGFEPVEQQPALIHGWHRAFSILSYESWGSPDRPGLAAALHPGGACRGLALRVAATDRARTLAYLDRRERAYRRIETVLRVPGRRIRALTYVFDPAHPRAAGKLPFAETARLIRQGVGRNGDSRDYLAHTCNAIRNMGENAPPQLDALLAAVDRLRSTAPLGAAC